jgi:hypothetical protein
MNPARTLTLDNLALAMRGMPRDAPIAIRLDGRLYRLCHVTPQYVRDMPGAPSGPPMGPDQGVYTIVLEAGEGVAE